MQLTPSLSSQRSQRGQRHHHIAFIHTAPAHVAIFTDLMLALAPSLNALHIVREDLLTDAHQPCIGIDNPALISRIKRATRHAGDSGARVVVCTCSTIGGVVEALQVKSKKQAMITTRIDRAMADAAINRAAPIMLVATLESTLAPSSALLQSSAAAANTFAHITPLLVKHAWAHFLAGNQAAYIDTIVETVMRALIEAKRADPQANSPTVVLAQASMHGAVAVLAARGVAALSSPEIGVRHALALYAQQQAQQQTL